MKRTRGIALAMALLLGAAACGDDDTTTETGDGPATTTTSEPDTTTTGVTTTTAQAPLVLTSDGLPGVQVGMTEEEAFASGLVDAFGPSCQELAGPDSRSADLKAPVEGDVFVFDGAVERLSIKSANVVTEPGGVRVGDDVDAAVAAFEAADLDVGLRESEAFATTFVDVRDHAGEFVFMLSTDPEADTIATIGAPSIFLCE